MASTNTDSMAPTQGEFQPSRPRDEPLTNKGHQVGRPASEEDAAPEFTTKTLPPGSAPADRTFQPNPISETPNQADNDATLRSHGKESTYTSAESTLGGATSADVHTGYGHPGQGETSNELRKDGKHTSTRDTTGPEGRGATGGSGLRDLGSHEAEYLASHHTEKRPISGYNVSRMGAEDRTPTRPEEVAAEGGQVEAA